ncbi:MAG: sigma-70 family RNA polymerase sigma factor [Trueperaceae bacterium]|nr:sigma-70 family RNA polymerase sigma factor [Trueperaceae bacterium]
MTMEVMSDAELVMHMSARQEDALVELHRRYAPYLAAVARRMLKDPDEVQQCVQDAFVNAWEYAARFDDKKASTKTWLVTICHRLAINRIRGTNLDTMPLENWDAPERQPDHVERIYVEEALENLDSEEKELINLAFFQGYSHGQVAEVTGRPLGTIKSKLRGALNKLKETLKGGEADG